MAAKTNSHPLVSIIILNWNGLEDTKLCLEHVQKMTYPNYEVIVVDNGSSAEEKAYLSKLKGITYVDNPVNHGFAGGQTDGYNHSNGEFIFLLNNDAVVQSDYIDKAIPHFTDESVAVVGGKSFFWNDNEPLFNKTNRFYSYMTVDPLSAETTLNMTDLGIPQEVNVVSGSAVIVRRSVIERLGYLWEPFFAYYEETDLFSRYKRAGYRILYDPALHVWHKNGASSGAQGGSFFFYYHIFRNRYMYAVRNFDNDYLKLFKVNFYSEAKKSLIKSVTDKEQKRIAQAYMKAISYIKSHEKQLKQVRQDLEEELGGSYSRTIIREQTYLSLVIDARGQAESKVNKFIDSFNPTFNPLYEAVLLVDDNQVMPSSQRPDIRFIRDRKYFTTHSINLAIIAARNTWVAVADFDYAPDISYCVKKIIRHYIQKPSVISLSEHSALMTKDFFQQFGGFQEASNDLKSNINHLYDYASISQLLAPASDCRGLAQSKKDKLRAQILLDQQLFSLQHKSYFQKLLARYYRLQQLSNLLTWVSHPKISPRLKAGRLKNVTLSVATLNKKRLATEIKHMRNEVYLLSKDQKILKAAAFAKDKSEAFTDKQLRSIANIPVFIICFERVDDLRKLINKLEKMGLSKIVLIDNNSSYQPLLDYFEETNYQVIKLGRNIGHTSPWDLGIIRALIPYGYYIVTDPDVIPTDDCVENKPIEHLLSLHKKYPAHQKVGFGLKIDDLSDHYPLKKEVISWEKQFWQSEIEPNVFEAGVDTTFAVYKPGTFIYTLNPSLRTGEPFTARHMPWYSNPKKPTNEDVYYKMRAKTDVTSWNVDELPERYKEEMKNNDSKNQD